MTQLCLSEFEESGLRDLSELTEAERSVYVAVEREGVAVRQLARETGRRPGTIGNLLKRARLQLGDCNGEVSDTW